MPDGSNNFAGYIAANLIQADGFETIIIQNSGTNDQRAGFTAGTGGFILDTENMTNGAVDALINGRIADGNGGFIINDDVLGAIMFEDPAEQAFFSAASTVNSCTLDGTCPSAGAPINDEPDTIASDVREIHNETEEEVSEEEEEERAAELTPEAAGKKSPIVQPVSVVSTDRLVARPPVTDPVTGSGNTSLIGIDEPLPPADDSAGNRGE